MLLASDRLYSENGLAASVDGAAWAVVARYGDNAGIPGVTKILIIFCFYTNTGSPTKDMGNELMKSN